MRIARGFVIFFLILSMVGWGWMLYYRTLFILMLLRLREFSFYEPIPGTLEQAVGVVFFALAFSFAWCGWIVNTRKTQLLIMALGLSSSAMMVIGLHTGSSRSVLGIVATVLPFVALPLMVVAGFAFLRVTREHPALAKDLPKEGRNAS